MKGGNVIKTAKSAAKQLISAGTDRAIRAINGSGVNRLKKAQHWEQFADSTLHDAIDTANKARKTYQKGSGVNRLKKAQHWEQFADSTLHDAIDTANKARKTYQRGMGLSHSQTVQLAKFAKRAPLHMEHDTSFDASGYGLKHHKRLKGKALYAAGYS
jgi:hypothetical protein